MKKQYRYEELTFGKYGLCIWHDGRIIENREIWGDEIFNIIDGLKEDGYTYGYFKKEVKKARDRYEYMLMNMIEVKDE